MDREFVPFTGKGFSLNGRIEWHGGGKGETGKAKGGKGGKDKSKGERNKRTAEAIASPQLRRSRRLSKDDFMELDGTPEPRADSTPVYVVPDDTPQPLLASSEGFDSYPTFEILSDMLAISSSWVIPESNYTKKLVADVENLKHNTQEMLSNLDEKVRSSHFASQFESMLQLYETLGGVVESLNKPSPIRPRRSASDPQTPRRGSSASSAPMEVLYPPDAD